MKTILVTGPIGSGKSEVCRYIASKGYPVYDCDSRTKLLYENVPGLKRRIEEALEIEWSGISVIFRDAERRRKLEDIVYPLLVDDILSWKRESDSPVIFIESAIALDKPQLDGLYDEVLLVTADLQTRIARNPKAVERNGLQSFDEDMIDYRIYNDSTLESLHNKTDELLCKLI